MGCDIHFYVEVRANDGKWYSVDEWELEIQRYTDERVMDWGVFVPYEKAFYSHRDYRLFAKLAGVRREWLSGDSPDYMAIMPRGLPGDISSIVKEAARYWNGDGHSHSWLTLTELQSFDWRLILDEMHVFINSTLPRMKRLGSPDQVRAVFWFDN